MRGAHLQTQAAACSSIRKSYPQRTSEKRAPNLGSNVTGDLSPKEAGFEPFRYYKAETFRRKTGLTFAPTRMPQTRMTSADNNRFFSSAAAAYAAGCEAVDLRNYRRDRLLIWGERRGRANAYTAAEVSLLALALLLARRGLGLATGFAIVRAHEAAIREAGTHGVLIHSFDPHREGWGAVAVTTADRLRFIDERPLASLQVDLGALAERVEGRLRFYQLYLRAGSEDDNAEDTCELAS